MAERSTATRPRRLGTETSETRTRILDVTEKVMLADGYAAVSSRRVARGAAVTAALVHYYFATLDDLFLAVLRRRSDGQLERQRRLLQASAQPLRAIWRLTNDPAGTGLVLEYMALANHRKAIAEELARVSERFRAMQIEVLGNHPGLGEAAEGVDPVGTLMSLHAVAQVLVLERSIGFSAGHAEATALIERLLEQVEPQPG